MQTPLAIATAGPGNAVYAVVATLIAFVALVGVFWPRFRGHWKGSRIAMGAVSNLGFALVFGSGGLLIAADDHVSPRGRLWFVIAMLPGWVCSCVGYYLDSRATPSRMIVTPCTEKTLSTDR